MQDKTYHVREILTTDRLLLRELTQEDYPALSAILQDMETMYAYEGAFHDEETANWMTNTFKRYHEYGFGLWAVILLETGEMIGHAGITWQTVNDHKYLEIGYLFNRHYWGRGYAIEVARACKEYAFCRLDADTVCTIVRDTNLSSMNVAIRSGMVIRERFVKHYRDVVMPHYRFEIKRGQHIIYMVRCRDGSYYTGYTNDLSARIQTHNEGKGAKYTKGRRPVELIYKRYFSDYSEALRYEHQLKRMSRTQKGKMLTPLNPNYVIT